MLTEAQIKEALVKAGRELEERQRAVEASAAIPPRSP